MPNLIIYLALLLILVSKTAVSEPLVAGTDAYTGSAACAQCHQEQYRLWQGSHHDQAMQHASPDTVLGNFNDQRVTYHGRETRFYRKGDAYWVRTDGSDGQPTDFKVVFTFGITPLQQYLLETDKGRYQAFAIAWDSRDSSAGGQRWFHLNADDKVDHDDVLHWTRSGYNWNSGCAHCHSTNLKKNYDSKTNRYNTQWSEINIGCEACHGPGKTHVANRQSGRADDSMQHPSGDTELDQCGLCHSRRALLSEDSHNAKAMDTYEYRLLESSLYHVDGQIKDEVFDLGSYLQSKMHRQGVVCSDCHDAHALTLKQPSNALCGQCHSAATYEAPEHHHHQPGSTGAQCVSCHMPETTYMVVDPRRDHSLRIPRPDLSQALGVPNACSQCHDQQPRPIALDAMSRHFAAWYPERARQPSHGSIFLAAQTGTLADPQQLIAIANDETQSAYIRASALEHLRRFVSPPVLDAARRHLSNQDLSMQLAALKVIGSSYPLLDSASQRQLDAQFWPLLKAPARTLRFEAATILAGALHDPSLDRVQKRTLETAVQELIGYLNANADLPAEQLRLGVLYGRLNQPDKAQLAYQQALIIEPQYVPALLNSADLYRANGEEAKAAALLNRALAVDPLHAESNYAMGLLQIRARNVGKAVEHLASAARTAPNEPLYSYVYAVTLYESGARAEAVAVLNDAAQRFPDHPQIQGALEAYQ